MVNNYLRKTKKSFEKKHAKDIKIFLKRKRGKKKLETDTKIFLKRKNKKKRHYHRERNKNLPDEEKEKKVEYLKNYYLAHKKYLLS